MKSGIEILRCRRSLAVVAGMKKRMTTQNRQKSNGKKEYVYQEYCELYFLKCLIFMGWVPNEICQICMDKKMTCHSVKWF